MPTASTSTNTATQALQLACQLLDAAHEADERRPKGPIHSWVHPRASADEALDRARSLLTAAADECLVRGLIALGLPRESAAEGAVDFAADREQRLATALFAASEGLSLEPTTVTVRRLVGAGPFPVEDHTVFEYEADWINQSENGSTKWTRLLESERGNTPI